MTKLIDIEGIGPVYAEKLHGAGLRTVKGLLEKGATPKGRREIEESTGISHEKILAWVNHADLYRIKGVGSEYSDLLEASGVDTVPELAQRNAENLFKKIVEVNQEKKLVRRLPLMAMVESWIEQAKKLDRIVTY